MESPDNKTILEFQDIPFTHGMQTKPGSSTYAFPAPSISMNDDEQGDDAHLSAQPPQSIWSFGYYQQYFDVDTDVVLDRLINSMIPRLGGNFINDHIRPKPDLYGPFWICSTLVCVLVVFGNIFDYASTYSNPADHRSIADFRLVSLVTAVIFVYAWILPLILWTFLWYNKSTSLNYIDLLGAYGYSLAVFIPASAFLIIPLTAVQWIILILSALFSGIVLIFALWPSLKQINYLTAVISGATILSLHVGLAAIFKYCFFAVSTTSIHFQPKNVSNSTYI